MATFDGFRVVIVPDTIEVKRHWLARLLMPWRPRTKTVRNAAALPDGEVLHDKVNHVIYCNVRAFTELKKRTTP